MILLFVSLLLGQAGGGTPRCHAGKATCDPWADFRLEEPVLEEFLRGPYLLIVTLRGGITKIRYKSGRACGKARDAIEGKEQVLAPDQVRLPTVRIAYCVPLNP